MKVRNVEKKIFSEHRSLMGTSEIDSKYKYVKLARGLPTFGVHFFLAKVSLYSWTSTLMAEEAIFLNVSLLLWQLVLYFLSQKCTGKDLQNTFGYCISYSKLREVWQPAIILFVIPALIRDNVPRSGIRWIILRVTRQDYCEKMELARLHKDIGEHCTALYISSLTTNPGKINHFLMDTGSQLN